MHDTQMQQTSDLNSSFDQNGMPIWVLPLELKLALVNFSEIEIYDTSGGAVPGMCSPKWILG